MTCTMMDIGACSQHCNSGQTDR